MSEKNVRTLPADINAEAAVLSAMMIDNYSVAKAIELMKEEYFYRSAHKTIFRNLIQLFEKNIEIDIITLIHQLDKNGELEKVGGKQYLNDLSDMVMSGANISYHANIVIEKALLRELIQASNRIIEQCYESENDVRMIVDEAEQTIFRVAEMPNTRGFVSIKDIIPDTLQSIEDIASTKTNVLGVSSGFPDLDRLTGGFRKGQFIVIAARPAMGKTSFALNIAFNASMFHDQKVGVFTLEMANDELLMRIISSAAEVPMDTILKGYGMDQNKILRIAQVAEGISGKDLYIDDNGSCTVLEVRAKSRRLKAEIKGLDLIIIDYLQLMASVKGRENRQAEIAEISRALKILAKELEVPVVALSQLNRGLESRDDKRPRLSDLRESGAIEQDADLVMFIYRDEIYNAETPDKNVAEIIIGKNRHGATGTIKLLFKGEFTQFKALTNESYHF